MYDISVKPVVFAILDNAIKEWLISIDDENDRWEHTGNPTKLATFNSKEDAEKAVEMLKDRFKARDDEHQDFLILEVEEVEVISTFFRQKRKNNVY